MKRRLILTQEQVDEICNGDSTYLDGLTNTPDLPDNMYSNEITTGGGLLDGYADPVTTDKYAKTLTRQNGMFGTGRRSNHGDYVTMYEGKKKDWERLRLNETNSDLDGQNIKVTVGNGDNAYKVSGSENALELKRHRAEMRGDDELSKSIDKVLDNRRDLIKTRKKNLKDLGMSNQFIGKHTKNSGNGKGHIKKDGTNQYINYLE